MNLATKITGTILFGAGLMFTASTAQARFLQTDPIGYEDQMNLYGYVHNDPLNATDPFGLDTIIKMKANPIGKAPITGVFGHAFIEYTDTNTGEQRISRAGPSAPYPGGGSDALKGKTFSGVNIETDDRIAKNSIDYNQPGAVEIQSVTVKDDIGVVSAQLKSFNNSVDKSNIAYNPKAQNSNTYAGDAFEEITGVEPKNNTKVDLHGLKNDLPIKKPTP